MQAEIENKFYPERLSFPQKTCRIFRIIKERDAWTGKKMQRRRKTS